MPEKYKKKEDSKKEREKVDCGKQLCEDKCLKTDLTVEKYFVDSVIVSTVPCEEKDANPINVSTSTYIIVIENKSCCKITDLSIYDTEINILSNLIKLSACNPNAIITICGVSSCPSIRVKEDLLSGCGELLECCSYIDACSKCTISINITVDSSNSSYTSNVKNILIVNGKIKVKCCKEGCKHKYVDIEPLKIVYTSSFVPPDPCPPRS